MPTQEERLTTLQKSSSTGIQDVHRNVTMLLGIVSSQQLDIKEIKISLVTVEERMDTIEEHLGSLEGRFETQEKKLDQVLHLLTTFTTRPEQ